jgi:omega-amidase
MRIFGLELHNDTVGLDQRKAYIESLIAGLDHPDLIVLPELAICGYVGNESIWRDADANGEATANWAMTMAAKYRSYIAVGFLEKTNGDYFNSYLIADATKVYGVVRKSEGESFLFRRGDFSPLITTPFGDVAVGICYDARRRHFYTHIKDNPIALILFPHGSPNHPRRQVAEERENDALCTAYVEAFGVPVCYVNSVGKMGFMLGITGRMMKRAGFQLNGLSRIYSSEGTPLHSNVHEAIGLDVLLTQKTRVKDIVFYGDDIKRGNFLFRHLILKKDIKDGIRFYESNKGNRI